jgi:hypothetical protein
MMMIGTSCRRGSCFTFCRNSTPLNPGSREIEEYCERELTRVRQKLKRVLTVLDHSDVIVDLGLFELPRQHEAIIGVILNDEDIRRRLGFRHESSLAEISSGLLPNRAAA